MAAVPRTADGQANWSSRSHRNAAIYQLSRNRALSPFDLLEELKQKHEALYKWAKARQVMFIEIGQYEKELTEIMGAYPPALGRYQEKASPAPIPW